MLESLEIDVSSFARTYKDGSKRTQEEFNLPKRETLVLVSGNNVQMRARIIDRWPPVIDTQAKLGSSARSSRA